MSDRLYHFCYTCIEFAFLSSVKNLSLIDYISSEYRGYLKTIVYSELSILPQYLASIFSIIYLIDHHDTFTEINIHSRYIRPNPSAF